jgi:hypothetical protein
MGATGPPPRLRRRGRGYDPDPGSGADGQEESRGRDGGERSWIKEFLWGKEGSRDAGLESPGGTPLSRMTLFSLNRRDVANCNDHSYCGTDPRLAIGSFR